MRTVLWVLVILFASVLVALQSLQSSTEWEVGEVVRTPEARFANLSDYPFVPATWRCRAIGSTTSTRDREKVSRSGCSTVSPPGATSIAT